MSESVGPNIEVTVRDATGETGARPGHFHYELTSPALDGGLFVGNVWDDVREGVPMTIVRLNGPHHKDAAGHFQAGLPGHSGVNRRAEMICVPPISTEHYHGIVHGLGVMLIANFVDLQGG